jgi:DNA replication regulator DPB11
VTDLGGVHKYDLTPDVTHLIVGDYDTPKYRHVARERPDIKAMAAGWIDAARSLWVAAQDIDFAALETEYQLKPFERSGGVPSSAVPQEREREKLLICLTGFEENYRHYIEDTVKANGGDYIGDLSRRVTHLVVCKPEGKKYQAAKDWGIYTVSMEWMEDSVQRGMVLEESRYDPLLPKEERGNGAIVTRETRRVPVGKRTREGQAAQPEEGRRKLRKTASVRLNSQSSSLWGDILGTKQSAAETPRPALDRSASTSNLSLVAAETPPAHNVAPAPPPVEEQIHPQAPGGIFASCRFFVHGFPRKKTQIVHDHVSSHDGQVSQSLSELNSQGQEPEEQRFLVVPQNSQPDTHPRLPDGAHIVTEFYIERCIHNKKLFDPDDQVLGRPFPSFPIDGFDKLTLCTAGFRNEQLNQVEKAVVQLGAKYAERLNKESSVLVCPSTKDVRANKLDFALLNKIPVVSSDWLWQCISVGCLVPWDKFVFPGLKSRIAIDVDPELEQQRQKLQRTRSEPVRSKEERSDYRSRISKAAVDKNAFSTEEIPAPAVDESTANYDTAPTHQEDLVVEAGFDTAPTHQVDNADGGPLSELDTNALNKSDQPPRKPLRRFPTEGTIGDSECGDDTDSLATQKETKGLSATQVERERERNAERQALASRLTSLMDPHSADSDTKSADAHDATTHVNSASATVPRRKREILGRAVSNASMSSSVSADSNSNNNVTTTTTKTRIRAARIDSIKTAPAPLGLLDGMLLGGGDGEKRGKGSQGEDDAVAPAATQIGYDDPEARSHREMVMTRMNGGVVVEHRRKSHEGGVKVTMESLRSETLESAIGTAASRRTRRR